MRALAITIAAVLLSACRHQPVSYTLKREGLTQVLTPPASKPEIKSARRHPARKTGCDVEGEPFTVAWHGNTARIGVKTEAYYTAGETGPRIYSDSLAQIETFRDALAAREDSGCFRDNEGAHLRQAMVETFPLPPQIGTFLRFGTFMRTGFIDLTPDFVFRLVNPTSTEPEVSVYEVKAVPGDDRVRITLASGAGKPLAAPQQAAYFRYLYWTGGSTPFRTTILGVPEHAMMRAATSQFLASPESYCATPPPGILCRSIAVSVGMNAGFYIHIDEKPVFARLGGTLAEALGEKKNISVRRLFHGKLIPIKVDGPANNVLSLIAMPSDEITSR